MELKPWVDEHYRTRLRYSAFPEARHEEESWASRAHMPLQFFFAAF